jgi:glycerol-3-phosphate dehydrogenase
MTSTYSTDIVIFGGGIAGLWLLNRFRSEGYQVILLEAKALGSGQTVASQGIIHGGLKYALSGSLSGAAEAIANMPARWRQCLRGEGDVDLRGCRSLSEQYYMWSDSGFRSKLKTFLGSKSLRGRVEAVDKSAYPAFFKQATVDGTLYQLPDFVVDTESLLTKLAHNQKDCIYRIDAGSVSFLKNNSNHIERITLGTDNQPLHIEPQQIIFCAGEGNAALITQADLRKARSQVRPLHMVYLKKPGLPSVFVHCIGDSFSLTPKLTVTSHVAANGTGVWYLGGELAETGVTRNSEEQILEATALLAVSFPWLDLSNAQWGSFKINRAEANVSNNYRPDDALFIEEGNVMVAWPTKLSLTPSLADMLTERLRSTSVTPMQKSNSFEISKLLSRPETATTNWN